MRFDMGFGSYSLGEIPAPDFKNYRRLTVPGAVTDFMSGQYVNGAYSKSLPEQRLVQDYEDQASSMISSLLIAFDNSKGSDPTLTAATSIQNDLQAFKEYMTLKTQVEHPFMGTSGASNTFYNIYFKSFSKFTDLLKWLSANATQANQELMDEATFKVGDLYSDNAASKNKFYRERIVPLKNYFSQDDQQFLKDNFINSMDGEISLDDLVRVYSMIAPYTTIQEYAPVYKFSYEFVLGEKMGSDVLNVEVNLPYGKRKIQDEEAEIRGKYGAIASRLGSWLDPSTAQLFEQHIEALVGGYKEPNNPKYYVSPTGSQITQNFMLAITNALASVQGKLKNGVSVAPVTADQIDAAAKSSFNGLVPALVLGGVLWYLFKGRN